MPHFLIDFFYSRDNVFEWKIIDVKCKMPMENTWNSVFSHLEWGLNSFVTHTCTRMSLSSLRRMINNYFFFFWRLVFFCAHVLEFIIKYSIDLYIEQQKDYINEILNKETTDFDFNVFEYIIDNYDNTYCIRGCVETLTCICTKFKKLPSNKTQNELSDAIFDIAWWKNFNNKYNAWCGFI